MKLVTPCEECRIKDLCKRNDTIEERFRAIRVADWPNGHHDSWPLEDVINFDDDSDGLVFTMDCDDFIEVKENSDVH